MAKVELRKKNGKWLTHFYVRVYERGATRVINTKVPWRGVPPALLSGKGDADFEVSREEAEIAADGIRKDAAEKGDARYLTARIVESKTGRKWSDQPITKLTDVIAGTKHRRTRSQQHEVWKRKTVQNFVEWSQARKIMTVLKVTPSVAAKYMASFYEPDESGRVRTAASIRKVKAVLGRAMVLSLPSGIENPFKDVIVETPDGDVVVNRAPLNAAEIDCLLKAASIDPTIFDLIVTGLCTGLRRGDVCRLRWSSVDTRDWVLKVTTAKTKAELYLPVMPGLQEVIERRLAEKSREATFVFPEAEKLLRENPSGLSRRVKCAFARAFAKPPEAEDASAGSSTLVSLGEVLPTVLAAVDSKTMSPKKRDKMKDLLRRYAAGQSYRVIQSEISISRGGISVLLHEAQECAGIRFLPNSRVPGINAAIREVTRSERAVGLKAASKYDFHALRTTFVTLALNAGISVDKLKALTGHSTVEVVLRHYFKPRGTDVQKELEAALPRSLTGRKTPIKAEAQTKALSVGVSKDMADIAGKLDRLNPKERDMLISMLSERNSAFPV